MKRVVKTFLFTVATLFYVSLLFLSATTLALRFTLAEPVTIKTWLKDSGVYESIAEEVSKNATIQQTSDGSVVQITSKDIVSVAQEAFPSSTLQRAGESVIDGFYSWFKGDTTGPEFRIDLTQEKALFANLMAKKLESKINELPECSDTGVIKVQAFDPFTADCKPKGVDLTKVLANFEDEIAKSTDLLSQTVFTGGDIKIDNSSSVPERIGSALPWVPKAYTGLLWAPFVIVGLTVIVAIVSIFGASSKRKGVKRTASNLLFVGIVLVASGLLLWPITQRLNRASTTTLGDQASLTQNIVNPLFEEVAGTYSLIGVYFGAGYIAVSLFLYGGVLLTRGKKEAHEAPEATPTEQPVAWANSMHESSHELATGEVSTEIATITSTSTEPVYNPAIEATQSPNIPEQVARPTETANRPTRPVNRRPPMIQG